MYFHVMGPFRGYQPTQSPQRKRVGSLELHKSFYVITSSVDTFILWKLWEEIFGGIYTMTKCRDDILSNSFQLRWSFSDSECGCWKLIKSDKSECRVWNICLWDVSSNNIPVEGVYWAQLERGICLNNQFNDFHWKLGWTPHWVSHSLSSYVRVEQERW